VRRKCFRTSSPKQWCCSQHETENGFLLLYTLHCHTSWLTRVSSVKIPHWCELASYLRTVVVSKKSSNSAPHATMAIMARNRNERARWRTGMDKCPRVRSFRRDVAIDVMSTFLRIRRDHEFPILRTQRPTSMVMPRQRTVKQNLKKLPTSSLTLFFILQPARTDCGGAGRQSIHILATNTWSQVAVRCSPQPIRTNIQSGAT
jgi:hypothetical protein